MAAFEFSIDDLVRQIIQGEASTDLVVTEYVLIASTGGWDADGNDVTQVIVIPGGGGEHRIMGLIEHARVRMQADVLNGYTDRP